MKAKKSSGKLRGADLAVRHSRDVKGGDTKPKVTPPVKVTTLLDGQAQARSDLGAKLQL